MSRWGRREYAEEEKAFHERCVPFEVYERELRRADAATAEVERLRGRGQPGVEVGEGVTADGLASRFWRYDYKGKPESLWVRWPDGSETKLVQYEERGGCATGGAG